MTNPLNSYQTNYGRFYAHPAAGLQTDTDDPFDLYAPRPSITNIIGMMHKSFLAPWYAKLVAEYAVTNMDALRYQVERFGPEVAIGSLKAVPSAPNVNAAIGDEIHAAIDDWCQLGHLPETHQFSTTTAAQMFAQWLHFADSHPMRIIRSEFTVWSYEFGYAGTGDLMWQADDGYWIVDAKSGNRVYPEVALQTSALAHADVILDANGNEHVMPVTQVQGVMHIRPRSVKLHRLEKTDQAWETFLACKRIFDWKRFDAPLVIQEPLVSQKTKDGK